MSVRVLHGDCREVLKTLPAESVHCVVTSPPYFGLRDYGTATWEGGDPGCDHAPRAHGATRDSLAGVSDCHRCGARRIDSQIGLEPTPDAYVAEMVAVFREIRRVLRTDGVAWLNLGDSYSANGGPQPQQTKWKVDGASNTQNAGKSRQVGDGFKPKDLIGIPWRVAFALQADGWYLRQDIIWAKPNPMPESVRDRCTKSHEYVFMLTKSARYFWDAEAIAETAAPPGPTNPRARYGGIMPSERRGEGKWQPSKIERKRLFGGGPAEGFSKPPDDPSLRNRRSVWTIATQPFTEAHFATMPPDLAELCIKAGTSERGCCPECGAPWARVVEKIAGTNQTLDRPKRTAGMDSRTSTLSMSGGSQGWQSLGGKTITLGWQPSCSCPERQPVPCTVLDPFGGAGTTGLVADRLQRDAILIELNSDYAAMAEKRIHNDAPLFADAAE